MSYGGEGIGRIDKKVIFIPYSAPGDVVRIEIKEIRHNFMRGEIRHFHEKSEHRVVPPCDIFGECGGCQWQFLGYESQLMFKQKILSEVMKRMGGLDDQEWAPTEASPTPYRYRNRVTFHLAPQADFCLGFYRHRSKLIVPVKDCLIVGPLINSLVKQLWEILPPFYEHLPMTRIDIGRAEDKEELILAFWLHPTSQGNVTQFIKTLKTEIPQIYGVTIYHPDGDSFRTEDYGNCCTHYRVNLRSRRGPRNIVFRRSEGVFSQVNYDINRIIIQKIYDLMNPRGHEIVADLYCGQGNISVSIAQSVKKVIGIESNEKALKDAIHNAKENGCYNCEFIEADMVDGLERLLEREERIHCAILDPPRAGGKEVMYRISSLAPDKIIYISCNPTTLARDLSMLGHLGYRVRSIQSVDMFSQTYHIETVTELVRA